MMFGESRTHVIKVTKNYLRTGQYFRLDRAMDVRSLAMPK